MNARLQIKDEAFGINASSGTTAATSHRDYYPNSGYVQHYDWQALGNLAYRHDLAKNVSETFNYDLLNRLTQAQVTNGAGTQPAVTYAYDALGDVMCKSDVTGGTCSVGSTGYTYGGTAGPHAVTSTSNGYSYSYDPDGNMTNRNGTEVDWNSDNQPTCIDAAAASCASTGTNYSRFNYAPDKHRYYQSAKVNGQTETTVYAGALEIVTDGTGTHNRYNLSAYGKAVAIVDLESDVNSNPVINTQYLLTDHLGSVDEAVDTTGTLIAGTGWSFEAFGKRRDPASWAGSPNSTQVSADRSTATSNGITSGVTHRGFTGHEMLDNVALIHANGRIYDPALGRFLSVDPVFQAPTNGQSLNPYSYVLNNPLSLTDPSGYCNTQVATPDGSGTTTVSCNATAASDGSNLKPGETAQAVVHIQTETTGSHITDSKTITATVTGGNGSNGKNDAAPSGTTGPDLKSTSTGGQSGPDAKTQDRSGTSPSKSSILSSMKQAASATWNYINDPHAKPLLQEGATELAQYMADESTQTDSSFAAFGYDVVGDLATMFDYAHAGRTLGALGGIKGIGPADLAEEQAANLARFEAKLPANASEIKVYDLPNGGKAFQANSPAQNIRGSSATYEKQVDSAGKTTQYTKTTYGPDGKIIHVKDKISNETITPEHK